MNVTGIIEVTCSDAVRINKPQLISSNPLSYYLNSGLKVFTINDYITDDSNCKITYYTLANLTDGITQPDCPKIPDISNPCKSLTLSTAIINSYSVMFNISADGGAFI